MATTLFKSTEEALAFGKHANRQQIIVLRALRNAYLLAAKSCAKRTSIKDFDAALLFATHAQFMREALESAGQPLN